MDLLPLPTGDAHAECLHSVFPTLEEGMQHCEERFLHLARHHGIIKPSATAMSLPVRSKPIRISVSNALRGCRQAAECWQAHMASGGRQYKACMNCFAWCR